MNLFLIGFMGSGKTAAAKYLHSHHGLTVCETDQEIVCREGKQIAEIFDEYGEEYFRRAETRLLEEISKQDGLVVSCGGGMAMRRENVSLMKGCGRIIYLKAEPQTVFNRLSGSPNVRPLLRGHMNTEYIARLMEKHRPFYEAASDRVVSVDGKTIMEVGEEIFATIV